MRPFQAMRTRDGRLAWKLFAVASAGYTVVAVAQFVAALLGGGTSWILWPLWLVLAAAFGAMAHGTRRKQKS